MQNNWLHGSGDYVILNLHIQPGAKKTEVVGPHGDALKIRLAAPPVDGKANAALIDFLAMKLGISRTAVEIVSGQSSRTKRIRINEKVLFSTISSTLLLNPSQRRRH